MKERKFEFGEVVETMAVNERCKKDKDFAKFISYSFIRHICGDWGDLDAEDAELNEQALKNGDTRLFSAYIFNKETDEMIWIITEWDRSVTTILFPSDYRGGNNGRYFQHT